MDEPAASPEIVRLFPSFVWKSRLGGEASAPIQRAILESVAALRADLPELERSEVWQSRHGLHELPELAPLVLHIRGCVEQVLAFLRLARPPFEITGLWANVAAPGGAVRMHSHPNNFLSGVYYAQVQPGADTINFHDPRPQAAVIRPQVTELTSYNADQVVVQVEQGTTVIFPGWLVHSVDPNRSDRERLSLSFNAMFSSYAETMGQPMWGDR
jgi:uncharacterized protein (TIGR02466 family)